MSGNNNNDIISEGELVLVPTPGMGHLLSAVELAKLIIRRDRRVSVVIFIFQMPVINSSKIDDFVDSQTRDNPYPTRLTIQPLPPLSDPPEPTSPDIFNTTMHLNKPLVKQAVQDRIRAGSPRLSGFILDMFCFPMTEVATDFNVPSYFFITSGASFLTLLLHFGSLLDDKGFDIIAEYGDPDVEFEVPGFKNQLMGKLIPEGFLVMKEDNWSNLGISDLTRAIRKSRGILVNTFEELEPCGVQALLDQVDKGSLPVVYPVGPILELDRKSRGGPHQQQVDEEISIMKWLDDQPTSSVVYLCFGSMGSFQADQVKEMANGLEASGHRFLWSLRKPPPEGKVGLPSENETFVEALPEGFLERTAERGKIVGWAPQVSILGHTAIGGFVSHCGWNSTLESLWFGVPMATWPLYAEQQLNAFELVKELGLAVEISIGYRFDWMTKKANIIVKADEIKNGVEKLMSLDHETKNKVKEIKDKGRKALEDGGSSHNRLGQFIEHACFE